MYHPCESVSLSMTDIYRSQSTVMLAVDFSFLTFLGAGTPGSNASPSEIILYCSTVSTIASIIFSFTLLDMFSDPGFVYSTSAVCFIDRCHVCL